MVATLTLTGACTPTPSPSTSAASLPASPPAGQVASPVGLAVTVVNRSTLPAVVSLSTDAEAQMVGLLPGEHGTVSLTVGSPQNGIGVEVLVPPLCRPAAATSYPSLSSFSVFVNGAPDGAGLVVSAGPADWSEAATPPINGVHCPGG
jgi:hypothetical protein